MRTYRVWKQGEIREVKSLSRFKPRFAVVVTTKRWGRINCYSGKRANPENQIFFKDFEDLMAYIGQRSDWESWKACGNCCPHPDDSYTRQNGEWILVPGDTGA